MNPFVSPGSHEGPAQSNSRASRLRKNDAGKSVSSAQTPFLVPLWQWFSKCVPVELMGTMLETHILSFPDTTLLGWSPAICVRAAQSLQGQEPAWPPHPQSGYLPSRFCPTDAEVRVFQEGPKPSSASCLYRGIP